MATASSFGVLPRPKRTNEKGKTWSRAPRQRLRGPEDEQEIAYVATAWQRDPEMVVAIGGLDRERIREAGRQSWSVADGYSWVSSPW